MDIGLDQVTVIIGNTDSAPYDSGTFGDRVTFSMGNAVIEAARDLKNEIFAQASSELGCPLERLELKEQMVRDRDDPQKAIPLSAVAMSSYFFQGGPLVGKGSYFASFPAYAQDKVEGNPYPSSPAHVFSSQVVEVDVDAETGIIEVERIFSSHDVGCVVNPLGVTGQIEGGIMMGLGYGLWEELAVDGGRVINPNLADYKMPLTVNQPEIRIGTVEKKLTSGPYGAKGAGNPPVAMSAAAVANAIYDAVGVRIKDLPLTPEKVLQELRSRRRP
jgi:CO/xanthine dehydrogenase Mo-binding subunit